MPDSSIVADCVPSSPQKKRRMQPCHHSPFMPCPIDEIRASQLSRGDHASISTAYQTAGAQGDVRFAAAARAPYATAPRSVLGTSFLEAAFNMKNSCEIKRVLGVGTATMAEHLRHYKDPFEPSERRWTLEPKAPAARLEAQPEKEGSVIRPGSERRTHPRRSG